MAQVRAHHVVDETRARHLRRQVAPRHRLSHHAVCRARLRRRRPGDLGGEILRLHEGPVVVPGRCVAATKRAILDADLRRRAVQPPRQPLHHPGAQLRRHQPDRAPRHLDRLAGGGLPLIRRLLRVARQHRDTREVDVQLLGRDLRQRGDVALAQLHLAHRQAHGAVGLETQPLLHPPVGQDALRQGVAHRAAPARIIAAALATARRMRGCAPQRHRWLSSAAAISARLGSALRSSNALASMMMPDRQ